MRNRETLPPGTPVEFEVEQPCKDGTTIFTRNNAKLLRGPDGKPNLIVGVSHDITARRQTEAELRSLTARYEAILASVPDIIMEVDQNKVYTWSNEAGRRFFGDDVILADSRSAKIQAELLFSRTSAEIPAVRRPFRRH